MSFNRFVRIVLILVLVLIGGIIYISSLPTEQKATISINKAWVEASRYAMHNNGTYPTPDSLNSLTNKIITVRDAGLPVEPWSISCWLCPNTHKLIQLKAYDGNGIVIDSLDNFSIN